MLKYSYFELALFICISFLTFLARYDSTNNKPTKTIGHLPAPLLTKVSEMMTSDSHERVRLAACMCLHVCGNEELEVTEVLQYHIQCGLYILSFNFNT